MKVLLINNVHYRRGGADAVYLNSGELLEQYGAEVVYFNMLKEKNLPCKDEKYFVSSIESRPKGLKSTFIELRNFFYNPEAARKIEELIIKEKPDIAHIHLFWGCGISPSICKVLHKYNIPLVQTVHDYRMVCPVALLMDSNKHVCEKCQGKHFYHCALKSCSRHGRMYSTIMACEMYFHNIFFKPEKVVDGFIFVSHFSQNKHCELRPQLKKSNQTVLYNFTPIKSELVKKRAGNYLLFYGRLSSEKGVETLIKAMSQTQDVRLKIVGNGPEEETYRELSEHLNVKNVEFLGYKTGEELYNLISNASFVLVSSECYENNPMTIVESYSLGTPVIGSRIGGIPEIIEEGRTGFTFESGNVEDLVKTIRKAVNLSETEYAEMCSSAKTFANENFEKEGHYQKLISFYEQTINCFYK